MSAFKASHAGSLNAAIISISMGIIWATVVAYRAVSKGIGGEMGNSLLAGFGLGIGFALLYLWAVKRTEPAQPTHKVLALLCGIVSSVSLTIAFHYIGVNLAG